MQSNVVDIIKEEQNPIGTISLRADNIITFIPNGIATETSIDILKNDLITFLTWTKESGPLPFLSDNRTLKQMSADERAYIQDKVHLFASKIAIITDGGISIYLFNIFSYLNKPKIPMKAFKNIEDGINWLKE